MYKWVNAFILVAGSLMLVLTQSRSAIVVVGLMMCYQYRLVLQRYRWGLLAAVVIGGSALFYYKFESAMGRIVLWWQSVGIWLEHPIIGCGVGGFKGEYGQQLETFFSVKEHIDSFAQYADTTEFAFCDGLQLLAEQGVIGGLFCLLVLLLSLRKLYANERVLFFAFASLLVFCLFSYPFQLLPYQILAVVFVARAARYVGGKESPVWVNPLCLVMAAVLSYTCYGTIKARNDAYQEYKQFAGIIHESFIKDYYRLCPLCLDDKQFLFDFAKILQEKHRYLDSNAILRDGILISNDPMFWVLMGNNYKLMKLYVEAEKCYDTAYSRMPNRLYPLYKKMLLFEDIGNKSAMINVAKDIRKFHEKVSSPAVEEMKRKAETLLEQNRNLN